MEDIEFTKEAKKKATIYRQSEFFGIIKEECYLLEAGTIKYAQYDNAPFITYIKKGKRKPTKIIKGYNPYFLIIEGWNNIDPNDAFTTVKEENGVKISQSRFTCFDERYETEFSNVIDISIKNNEVEVLFDTRIK